MLSTFPDSYKNIMIKFSHQILAYMEEKGDPLSQGFYNNNKKVFSTFGFWNKLVGQCAYSLTALLFLFTNLIEINYIQPMFIWMKYVLWTLKGY